MDNLRQYAGLISRRLTIPLSSVENTVRLLESGSTIPFISRYRKEITGSLDETRITDIWTELNKLSELDKRRETILHTIEKQGKLSDELRRDIENALTRSELEDLYLPYKPKRKTRASEARKQGLEPLAKWILKQEGDDPAGMAAEYLSDEIHNVEQALQGARDIIAEYINEDKKTRQILRKFFREESTISSKVIKGKEQEGIKYSDYFFSEEILHGSPSHRILAMLRGSNEGFLKLTVGPDKEKALNLISGLYIKNNNEAANQVEIAIGDCYSRLLAPSLENEFLSMAKEKADDEAIRVFSENLRQLLLASPLGEKSVLAIDPGYRTGCKVVCLDHNGNLLHNETIYPHPPVNEKRMAGKKLVSLVNAFKIEAIAIGNGTAGRETENLMRNLKFDRELKVFVVSESGASVYSASTVAREEFPDHDVTVRGAVSIGRRLMDPLAELVKIDPKSIGVGQYQHDVNQSRLQLSLEQVVRSCVNLVGVEINTASKHLLTYVAGLGPRLAQNIVDFRKVNNGFKSREEIKKVKQMGDKAFEQCAGFLRVAASENPLDNSAVHPESYGIVNKMARDLDSDVNKMLNDEGLRKKINPESYISKNAGLPTLTDIIAELAKPGRDPRKQIRVFEFSKDVHKIEDLNEGMTLPGIVTNITNFGVFVDVGVKQDGLVHISNLKEEFVRNPADVVKLHEHVMVKVLSVDIPRKRIQLSLRDVKSDR